MRPTYSVERLDAFDARFGSQTATITQSLDEKLGALDEKLAALDERVVNKAINISSAIEGRFARIDQGLDNRRTNETGAVRTLELAKVLGEGGKEVSGALDSKAQEITSLIDGRSAAITQLLDGRSACDRRYATPRRRYRHAAQCQGCYLTETISARSEDLTTHLDNRSSLMVNDLSSKASEIAAQFDGKTSAIADALAGRVEEINRTLSDRADAIAAALDTRIERFEQDVRPPHRAHPCPRRPRASYCRHPHPEGAVGFRPTCSRTPPRSTPRSAVYPAMWG